MTSGRAGTGLFHESARYEYPISDCNVPSAAYRRNGVLLDWVGCGKDVLELGCSTGFFSKYLVEKRGCSVVGIEIDSTAAAHAQKYCTKVLVRDLSSPRWTTELAEKTFDVILMGDVLEHLADPASLLVQIQALLRPNASVVISLPNVVHWATRIKMLFGKFDYESSGTLDHTHLRFFTKRTAYKLIEDAGYEITRFHPVFAGPCTNFALFFWQQLAKRLPGIFAFQFLFQARIQRQT